MEKQEDSIINSYLELENINKWTKKSFDLGKKKKGIIGEDPQKH